MSYSRRTPEVVDLVTPAREPTPPYETYRRGSIPREFVMRRPARRPTSVVKQPRRAVMLDLPPRRIIAAPQPNHGRPRISMQIPELPQFPGMAKPVPRTIPTLPRPFASMLPGLPLARSMPGLPPHIQRQREAERRARDAIVDDTGLADNALAFLQYEREYGDSRRE